MTNDLMTLGELATYLHISPSSAYRLAEQGRLAGLGRKIGGSWRFRRSLVDAWMLELSRIRGSL